ncbi:ammonium transporter [Methanopyrus sp.]
MPADMGDLYRALATWGAQGPGAIFFLIWAMVLVVMMQVGFMFLESGQIRSKNATSIFMKCLVDVGITAIAFMLLGFAIAFPEHAKGIGWWLSKLFSAETWAADPMKSMLPYALAFALFQWSFCNKAVTIISGSVAERMDFKAYMLGSLVLSAVVYPVFALWVWGGGWMGGDNGVFAKVFGQPYHDFAGSTVVHAFGGTVALIAAWLLGPRAGRFKDGKPVPIPGHNIPHVFLGTLMLVVGWYGFNVGSSAVLYDPTNGSWVSSLVAANTTLAMCGALLSAGLASRFDPLWTANGILAGAVAICAGADVMSPIGALITGIVAGLIIKPVFSWLERRGIDDVVAAFPVHGVCGAWGGIAAGIFGAKVLGGVGGVSLAAQVAGVLVCLAYSAATAFVVYKAIDATVGLRVSEKAERKGLDDALFSTSPYPEFEIR